MPASRPRHASRIERPLLIAGWIVLWKLAGCSHYPHSERLLDSQFRPDSDYPEPWTTARARDCYLDTGNLADRLFPDYTACFLIPAQAEWRLVPLTPRAAAAMHGSNPLHKTVKPHADRLLPGGRELCFISGWMNNERSGYDHDNPWEYGNELLVKYRLPSDQELPQP